MSPVWEVAKNSYYAYYVVIKGLLSFQKTLVFYNVGLVTASFHKAFRARAQAHSLEGSPENNNLLTTNRSFETEKQTNTPESFSDSCPAEGLSTSDECPTDPAL